MRCRRALSVYAWEEGNTGDVRLPYLVVDILHHTSLGLSDGRLEAFCLTVTSHGCRSMAYCTVGVHLCYSLCGQRLIEAVPGTIHNLVEGFRRSNKQLKYKVKRVRWSGNTRIGEEPKAMRYWAEGLVNGYRKPKQHTSLSSTRTKITKVSNDASCLHPSPDEPFGGDMR